MAQPGRQHEQDAHGKRRAKCWAVNLRPGTRRRRPGCWLALAHWVPGDAAYNNDALQALIAAAGANAVIQPNPRRKNQLLFDPLTYKNRYCI